MLLQHVATTEGAKQAELASSSFNGAGGGATVNLGESKWDYIIKNNLIPPCEWVVSVGFWVIRFHRNHLIVLCGGKMGKRFSDLDNGIVRCRRFVINGVWCWLLVYFYLNSLIGPYHIQDLIRWGLLNTPWQLTRKLRVQECKIPAIYHLKEEKYSNISNPLSLSHTMTQVNRSN